jgi:hypothetical protein
MGIGIGIGIETGMGEIDGVQCITVLSAFFRMRYHLCSHPP